MSRWFNSDALEQFVENKINEDSKKESGRYLKWANPAPGDVDKNKTYTVRLLPDVKGNFYKKMHYHMIESGNKWHFILCPKSFNFENYCPICSAVYKLYKGSDADKKLAGKLKRKEKFVQNILVKEDPRDADQSDEALKVSGKVMLYEFPSKVEAKIKNQLVDKKNGLGGAIFDPSDEGFDLILKVKLTKPGPDGKKWPNYDDTEFARKSSAVADTDEEIDAVIKSTVDLDEYLNSLVKTEDVIIEILKNEMVYELIEEEVDRKNGVKKETPVEKPVQETKEEVSSDDSSSSDDDDEAFLADLAKL